MYLRLDSGLPLPPIVYPNLDLDSFAFSSTTGFSSWKQGGAAFIWEHFIEKNATKNT